MIWSEVINKLINIPFYVIKIVFMLDVCLNEKYF